MSSILAPKTSDPYDGRELDIEIEIHPRLQEIIADAVEAGWTAPEILQAVEQLTKKFSMEYEEDADPVENRCYGRPHPAKDLAAYPPANR